MAGRPIWIAIIIGVFFVGIGVIYAHFANTYDPMSMKFQNQELFNQMMSNNPKMSQHWMDSGMTGQQMQGQNESTQTETASYVEMVDGVQVVTVNANEFKFTPSKLNISVGKTKFVLINDGVADHELVVYEASKKDMIEKAEIAEDEETLGKNILFEIDGVHGGKSGESEVMDFTEGSYAIACFVPGHYDAGMKGTLDIVIVN